MVTGTPWPVPPQAHLGRSQRNLAPCCEHLEGRGARLTPRLLHYLLQELQDAVPLPGQALGLLGALQPDLGSLGVQCGHAFLGSRQWG